MTKATVGRARVSRYSDEVGSTGASTATMIEPGRWQARFLRDQHRGYR
jgi:hypothetical protein